MKQKRVAKGFEFIFRPEQLQALINQNPEKILFTTSLVEEVLKSGEKVSVMRIEATSIVGSARTLTVAGCPVPPCVIGDPEEITPADKYSNTLREALY
jgi:hypothetical protein